MAVVGVVPATIASTILEARSTGDAATPTEDRQVGRRMPYAADGADRE